MDAPSGNPIRRDVFGWFDSPESDVPEHDPGVDGGICPMCGTGLTNPVVTLSLSAVGGQRSYFYRLHKHCHQLATEQDIAAIDSILIDTEMENTNGLV